ncbi:hypothetical protein J6590_018544 [Homalodisca vitripennis]|nr:hypothetical protein J6590_018544 [Homalodisca vitripennis]
MLIIEEDNSSVFQNIQFVDELYNFFAKVVEVPIVHHSTPSIRAEVPPDDDKRNTRERSANKTKWLVRFAFIPHHVRVCRSGYFN